ncbi:NAD-dependent epimerase/dehydratase family protein [Asticcacaulis sp. 201]|uniref:NAD-dependent epimerase/dehydratase family protein n=1 Tax=Asticcacaulis sp. 201 TaxID=3028787 RepID=UPI002916EC4F|nr:NAD-dependent epimerase/dehydratase family protein [Asticcacaulis sp. 201]MDV6330631.1 NAD-dependent epimerase/dehydratase family protein [Asticcacaulis sp. 201]
MKVLVTGATGGLGKALVAGLIAAGYAVRATGRRDGQALRDMGADYIQADLTEAALNPLVSGIDGVFHAAALSSPWGRDRDFQAINVDVTRNLLAAARRAGCRRFIFVSSPSVYARERDQLELRESDPIAERPLNAYARTKGEAEGLVRAASDAGMACVALRPRAIIGPDDDVLLPRFLRLIKKGRFPLVHGGRALVELTDVRDVVRALIAAYMRAPEIGGAVINISGGQAVSVRALIGELADAMGRQVRFLPMPYGALRVIASSNETVCGLLPGRPEPALTVYTLSALAFSQTFDMSLARELIDYKPQYDAVKAACELGRRS